MTLDSIFLRVKLETFSCIYIYYSLSIDLKPDVVNSIYDIQITVI